MISLRTHMETYRDAVSGSLLSAYRGLIVAFGAAGAKSAPGVGEDLSRCLREIENGLSQSPDPIAVEETQRRVKDEVARWADRVLQHHVDNEQEIRQILGCVTNLTEAVSQRDRNYSREIAGLTGQMRTVADWKDLGQIRRSILDTAEALRTCVDRMAREGDVALRQMTREVQGYRGRLAESERRAELDPLTGLANRRAFERQLQALVRDRAEFNLLLLDLNGFKAVNDRYGHLAGDDLLRQFATELKAQFRFNDLVARWGGDEFAVLLLGNKTEAEDRKARIRGWALGEYKIATEQGPQMVQIAAAMSSMEWNGRETGDQLLARADRGVYDAKTGNAKSVRSR